MAHSDEHSRAAAWHASLAWAALGIASRPRAHHAAAWRGAHINASNDSCLFAAWHRVMRA